MKIQFIDLKAQFERLEKDIRARMDAVLEHGKYILGPEILELEEKLARFAGVKRAITCSSGTDALLMVLMAEGVGPGDAVFTTPFTFIATAEVISLLGATPVFVDIDPETYNIDPGKLGEAVERVKAEGALRPRAVIPVDIFGLPADYDPIMNIAGKSSLFALEDAAQGFGGVYKGRRAGALAHAGATSFFPAKPLGCYGDGGAIFTDDEEFAEKLVSIRVHGQGEHKYENVRVGLNARFDTLQAAVLLPKLEVFGDELKARQKVAERYTEGLKDVVKTPFIPEGYKSAWAQYSVQSEKRTDIMAALKEEGIPSAVYYQKPLHLQKAFEGLGYKEGDFPVSEEVSRRIFSLPMSPYITDEQVDMVIEVIRKTAVR